jgi:hypothetical protein
LLEGDHPPAASLEMLRALQAVDIADDGRITPEPTLLRVWNSVGVADPAP